ncbi:MAG: ABC transporter substrate-binding protein [Treponema sp.]|jgi:ABC-type nitrate/sulfonate/bicarbonate transport system substrate-binding protein|nr:ABC transporter substrate-binding protein [Treponema sp.]
MKKISIIVLALLIIALPIFAGGGGDKAKAGADSGKLRVVTHVVPRTAEVLEDTPFWVAQNLGYMAEEGLELRIDQAFGTTDLRMVATGNAEFCGAGPSYVLAAIEEGLPIKVVSAYDAINIWGMCVLTKSPIKDWEDMKNAQAKYGRKLTVALGDASWEMLVTPTLVAAGVNPKADIEWVVAGENRYIQVAEGRLDMLFSWPGEAWQLIGQNFDFRYIDGNDVLQTSSNPLTTSLKLIKEEPRVVQGYVRAMAKGIYFTKYNPEAAAAVSCKQWPNIDVTWKAAVYVQEGRNYQMFGKPGSAEEKKLLERIGWNWEDKWQLNVNAALESGVIKKAIPLDQIYTNEYVDNSWDRKKVERDADAYDIASVRARYKPE